MYAAKHISLVITLSAYWHAVVTAAHSGGLTGNDIVAQIPAHPCRSGAPLGHLMAAVKTVSLCDYDCAVLST